MKFMSAPEDWDVLWVFPWLGLAADCDASFFSAAVWRIMLIKAQLLAQSVLCRRSWPVGLVEEELPVFRPEVAVPDFYP